MTPRRFFALLDRVDCNHMRAEFGAAQVASILVAANSDPNKSKSLPTPLDFMPFAKKLKPKEQRMTAEDTASVLKHLFAPAFGGLVHNAR